MSAVLETKMDHNTLHFLPFLPTRKREKGFYVRRNWGNLELEITARETLNTYDLVTLLFTVKEYLKTGYKAGEINGKEVAGITINVKKLLKERGLLTKKVNRLTLLNSFLRLKTIDLVFINKQGAKSYTTYIYEIEVDKDITEIKIAANKKFIDFVTTKGILINLKRIVEYTDKEQYAILLDLYLQGTKRKKEIKGRQFLQYREKYYTQEIVKALKLDLTNMPMFKIRQVIKNTFKILNEKGVPLYVYNKIEEAWERTDINKHKIK